MKTKFSLQFTALFLLTLISLSLASCASSKDWFKSKRQLAKEQQEEREEKTSYQKIIEASPNQRSSKGSLCNIHVTEKNKVYLELPITHLEREFLVAATVTSTNNPSLALVGFKNSNPLHIRFSQKGKTLTMEVVNETLFYNPHQHPHLPAAQKLHTTNITLNSYPIEAYSPDSTSLLIDFTPFVLQENAYFPIMHRSVGSHKVSALAQPELSRVVNSKVFEDNATIAIERSFSTNIMDRQGKVKIKDYPTTINALFTLLVLPEEPMVPRISDTRIGVFQNRKNIVDPITSELRPINFVNRWRIEPADSATYFSGTPTPVKKPITFYIDSAFPKSWKEPISRGILRWNKSFEKIGLLNVIEVKDFPTNDPHFDPDNLKYSCIRYVPIAVQNAMGPSWTDPRTGEIINASTFVYNDIVELIQNWRFVQTAQLDPRTHSTELHPELFSRTLEYIIAHEIGHTLGFMHNMAASASVPVDSLRSPSFTQQYGTTASIMDYARFNYVAQPQDAGVALEPPFLGAYDHLLVKWTYQPFNVGGDYLQEAALLRQLLNQHEGDPRYAHGVQQFEYRIDPSAIEEDLGNDPIKASTYGMQNLRYIIQHMQDWLPDDVTSERKSTLYYEILDQALRYINAVYMNVSGIYLRQTSESSGLPRKQVVPKEQQRASAKWLLERALDFSSYLSHPTLENTLYSAGNRSYKTNEEIARIMAVSSVSGLGLSYYVDSTSYHPLEYLQDVYSFVFNKTIKGDEKLTQPELLLQGTFVRSLMSSVADLTQTTLQPALTGNHPFYPPQFPLHELYQHHCSVASCQHCNIVSDSFGSDYGTPEPLWMNAVKHVTQHKYHYLIKVKELLEVAVKQTHNKELQLHYNYLLHTINTSL